ncbi:MAG TPA: class I SAM-dependent methyltransferase [Acidimicrobiales bacterium]|nr:class I SAM-dependent methyltransferase [Acidimicrobiales bacterium]
MTPPPPDDGAAVGDGSLADAWDRHAEDWVRWARMSEADGFDVGTWPELRCVLAPPGGLVVDVGCGEGRLLRQLSALGHRALGVERSSTLVEAAAAVPGSTRVVRADAAALPLGDGVASMVTACMVLQDVDDLGGTVAEMVRVLAPGGVACVAIVHPFSSAQEVGTAHEDRVAILRPYLVERRTEDRIERDEVTMTFVSMHRPLSTYVSALTGAGLVVTDLREFGHRLIPWLLVLRGEKRPSG